MSTNSIIVKKFGVEDYARIWQDMRDFTQHRDDDTPDELWLLQHNPVYTQGQAGKPEHILQVTHIPIVQTDRGGQVTYHGPGQLIAYPLINLTRRGLGVRSLVCRIEQSVIDTLLDFGIRAQQKTGAPGIYVQEAKIGSLGLRIRRGCSYHGLALNVDMDLSPFENINPCGYSNLEVTQIRNFNSSVDWETLTTRFTQHFIKRITS